MAKSGASGKGNMEMKQYLQPEELQKQEGSQHLHMEKLKLFLEHLQEKAQRHPVMSHKDSTHLTANV